MQKLRNTGWPAMLALPAVLCLCVAFPGASANPPSAPQEPKPSSNATAQKSGTAPTVTVVKAGQLKEALTKAKGKVVVLNFWGTYCPPCVAEMPEFSTFYKAYQGKDALLLSVNCDDPADANTTVKAFIEAKKIPFQVLTLDGVPDEVSSFLGAAWDGALPTTYVYDSDGKLIKTVVGQTTAKELSAVVDPALPKKNPAK